MHKTALTIAGFSAFLTWLTIVALLIVYRNPHMDEGYYGMGTYNYFRHGQLDARQIEPSSNVIPFKSEPDTRVDKRAYFQMPLEMFVQCAWEKVFGWGLTQQRAFSAAFGMAALFFWFGFIRRLAGRLTAAIATTLIAFDWNFISAAAHGRMDMMAHACGLAALYFHERFYDRRPALARALSSASLCAAALTHPNGFFVYGTVYAVRSLFQWKKWQRREWLAFLGPVVLSSIGMAWWISFDPVAFRDQILANGAYRFGQIESYKLNDLRRYAFMYGFPIGRSVSEHVKVYALLYFIGGYFLLFRWGAKKAAGYRLCLTLAAAAFVSLAVFDATKWVYYGLHTVPWLAVIAAFGFSSAWLQGRKKTVLGGLALYSFFPLVSALYIAHQDPIGRYFQPAVEALRHAKHEGAMVFAPPEFLFGVPDHFLYDVRFGYISHRTVPAFALDLQVEDYTLSWAKDHNPGLYAHIERLLHTDCKAFYANARYAVYTCAPKKGSGL